MPTTTSDPVLVPAGSAAEDVRTIERELRRLLARARTVSSATATAVHPQLDPALYALLMDVVAVAPARAVDLVQRRGISKSVISRQVATLEGLGLITRETDPNDARASVIVLTEAGREAARTIEAARRTYLKRLFEDLSAADLTQIAHSLGRLNDVLG
ncbi:MAG: MarR family transcriptional regulator [Actinobacteria bacterium]|nr:MarR family transcriptional regulator [Actinomycetota bacterium]